MKAVVVTSFGGPDLLEIHEQQVVSPGPGEIAVRIAFAGVNYIDVYMRNGTYARSHTYQTPLPMTLGMEGVGTVEEVGTGVTDFRVGDRVGYCLARGSYAERAIVPAWRAVKVPADIPSTVATALMLQGCTAHYLTHSAFPLAPGQTCLIQAGAGGVGQLLVQLAKARGARVLATVGSAEKAAIAKSRGADECILYRETDFRAAVLDLTGGRGVDVVYDSVGLDTIHRSIRSLRKRGTCILFGASSGVVPSIEPLELAEAGSVFFTRPHLADYTATAEEIRGRADDLFDLVRSGKLTVAIDREFALADAADAHRYLEARETKGKLLLRAAA
ncbi:MAG: putative quinone oxidoreductase [Rhodospirillales bacterium]|nr:putative quinone oxidoreductase [Rhodospirillales bacterium]